MILCFGLCHHHPSGPRDHQTLVCSFFDDRRNLMEKERGGQLKPEGKGGDTLRARGHTAADEVCRQLLTWVVLSSSL